MINSMKNDPDLLEEHKEKKNYELGFLIKNEEELKEILRLFGQHQIEVGYAGPLKKIKLAYLVKHTEEAYFGFIYFSAISEQVKILEHDTGVHPAILRSFVVKMPRQSQKEDVAKQNIKPLGSMVRPTMGIRRKEIAPKPISNEALEKKIEEILQ